MTRLGSVIILIMFSLNCYSQGFIEGGATYNSFDMSDMKTLQKELLNVPFETRASHTFDPYVGFQLSGGRRVEMDNFIWQAGAILSYTSTGGRTGYSDYSGVIRADQLLSLTSLGVFAGIEKNYQKWTFGFDLPLLYDMTSLTIKSEIIVNGTTIDEDKYKFHSQGVSLQPRANVFRNFSDFSLGLTLGFHTSVYNDNLKWSEDDESPLTLENSDKPLKAQWNGLRAGILLRYKIF